MPNNGVFRSDLVLIPPEAADPAEHSDGASAEFSLIDASGKSAYITDRASYHWRLYPIRNFHSISGLDKQYPSTIQSNPNGTADYDYVFLADPVVLEPKTKPKRVVWVFIDTLRQDHLSMYGYERKTTPKLDAWAQKNAGIYTEGRSIVSWTLPSARTMVTGSVPERWGTAPTLQSQLAEQGWYTTMLVGNIYIFPAILNTEGLDQSSLHQLAPAEVHHRAKQVLEQHNDRDGIHDATLHGHALTIVRNP